MKWCTLKSVGAGPILFIYKEWNSANLGINITLNVTEKGKKQKVHFCGQ
jgi:hypothetical protein